MKAEYNKNRIRMGASSTVTIRIPSELDERLTRLVDATGRSGSWLATHALEIHVDEQERQVEKIREGQRDLRVGRTVSHEKVSRWLRSWGKKRELPPP